MSYHIWKWQTVKILQVKRYENLWLNESIITKVTCVANVIVSSTTPNFQIGYKKLIYG